MATFLFKDDTLYFAFRCMRFQNWLCMATVCKQFARVADMNALWQPVHADTTAKYVIDPEKSVHVDHACGRRKCNIRNHYKGLRRVDLKRRFRDLKKRCLTRLRRRASDDMDRIHARMLVIRSCMWRQQRNATYHREQLLSAEAAHRRCQTEIVQAQHELDALL